MLQGDMKNKEVRQHPTQKPVPVMRWILDRYAKPGMVVCDPFCGSGTTLVAAEGVGLGWVGIEREADYCGIAQARVEKERAQGKLF
jgi:site-specific DNA-methyltransferase (adenine-specific)